MPRTNVDTVRQMHAARPEAARQRGATTEYMAAGAPLAARVEDM
jgi:hypothetical protein